MTRSIGATLPQTLLRLLDGADLETKIGTVIECITTDGEGWPYMAMVSVGELVAVEEAGLRLAIWSASTTRRNLERTERCVLTLVHEEESYQIRCTAQMGGNLHYPPGPDLTVFDLSISDVLEDSAPYATLTSGIRYTLHDPAAALTRWRQVIEALRG